MDYYLIFEYHFSFYALQLITDHAPAFEKLTLPVLSELPLGLILPFWQYFGPNVLPSSAF